MKKILSMVCLVGASLCGNACTIKEALDQADDRIYEIVGEFALRCEGCDDASLVVEAFQDMLYQLEVAYDIEIDREEAKLWIEDVILESGLEYNGEFDLLLRGNQSPSAHFPWERNAVTKYTTKDGTEYPALSVFGFGILFVGALISVLPGGQVPGTVLVRTGASLIAGGYGQEFVESLQEPAPPSEEVVYDRRRYDF